MSILKRQYLKVLHTTTNDYQVMADRSFPIFSISASETSRGN